MYLTVEAARAAAKRLHKSLDRLGRGKRLTLCQDIVAKSCGWRDWRQLTQTVGTAQAPRASKGDPEAVQRRFASLIKDQGIDIETLFDDVFRLKQDDVLGEEQRARLRNLVRKARPSEAFGSGMNTTVFRLGRTKGKAIETDDGVITLSLAVNDETLETGMPIYEVRAWLKRADTTIGFIEATAYMSRGVFGDAATEIADIVSTTDVWATLNLRRDAGDDIFRQGVLILWHWEILSALRGAGLGRRFLQAVLRELKRRYRRLVVLALDPASPNARIDFQKEKDSALLSKASMARLREFARGLDIGQALGPKGRVVLFDNSREASELGTVLTMGAIYATGREPRSIPDEDVLERTLLETQDEILGMVRRQKVAPLGYDDFPEGYHGVGTEMSFFNPYPKLHHHMPAELSRISILLAPPDVTFRSILRLNPPQRLIFEFENGEKAALPGHYLLRPLLGAEEIMRLNAEQPKSPILPSYGHGDLLAVLMNNSRLLFSHAVGKTAEIIPMAAADLARMHAPVFTRERYTWMSPESKKAFLEAAERTWASVQDDLAAAIRAMATDILAGGRMQREMYDDTFQGKPVLRQRFHPKPWDDVGSLTLESIGSELSPTMPFAASGCPAHEHFTVRHLALIGTFARRAIEAGLAACPEERAGLERTFVESQVVSDAVEASAYIDGLWEWWRQIVFDRADRDLKAPLTTLASGCA